MKLYFIKRVFLIIPTLIILSWIIFFLAKKVPQDPVISLLISKGATLDEIGINRSAYKNVYRELGLDKPTFYFSIIPSHYPKNLNAIIDYKEKYLTEELLKLKVPFKNINAFLSSQSEDDLTSLYNRMLNSDSKNTLDQSNKSTGILKYWPELNTNKVNFIIPKFHWHGWNNQYHQWVTSAIKGDFGYSIINGRKAISSVSKALMWTLASAIPAILITFGLSVLLAYFLVKKHKTKIYYFLNSLLLLLYSLPLFWLATVLVVFFTTDNYGAWTNIFPSVGVNIIPSANTLELIWYNKTKLILPIICLCYTSLVYLVFLLKRSLFDELEKPYIITAKAAGLSYNKIIREQALPNALLPLVTLFVGAFPAVLGGSVILEVIFNLPGIGRLLYSSINSADWNVAFCIMLITGFVTVSSYLIGDIIYSRVDPKIRFD